ncbi:MAG: hypothetical protein IVW57_13950, partial [Ktedonobacterales bacterium]|nr:hypothetical protein [Ktedonobacterales bacterium]
DTTTDPEAAMWMMIAASPALSAMRDEAERWLVGHGHQAEAQAILGGRKPGASRPPSRGKEPQGKARRPGHRPARASAANGERENG